MKKYFDKALEKAVLNLLHEVREIQKSERLGFVSGIIFSEGLQYKERNLKRLAAYTEKLRTEHDKAKKRGVTIHYVEEDATTSTL